MFLSLTVFRSKPLTIDVETGHESLAANINLVTFIKFSPTYLILCTRYYWSKQVKVKCTPVQALRPCTGRTAHWGSRGIALLFHNHGTRREWGVSVTPWPLFTPGKDRVPIVQEAGWAPGPVWTGVENLAPTEIQSPDRPARRQSLYRLSYPVHYYWSSVLKN